jgi:hypothetical protein
MVGYCIVDVETSGSTTIVFAPIFHTSLAFLQLRPANLPLYTEPTVAKLIIIQHRRMEQENILTL